MNAAWLSLCGLGLLVVLLLRDAITNICQEEIKTRLSRLPYVLLRVIALRFPRGQRQDVISEWRAELDFILSETDGLPLTRLLRGIRYSASLLGLMLPFATIRDSIAAWWYRSRFRARRRLVLGVVAVGHELDCPEMDDVRLRGLARELQKTGTCLVVSSAPLDAADQRTTVRPTADLTLLHVDHPQLDGMHLVMKNLFDRCMAAVLLILLAPVIVSIALAIKLGDGGPALFTQVRVGKDGRTFRIYKFRTMVVDADKRKALLLASYIANGVLIRPRRDPRVTTIGSYLRRWSIDNLPQLLNVFLGDMSLVGPRPALPDEVERYADHVRRRLVVKPGLTGLWQVSGRSDLSWDESLRLDLRYVENWSFALDLQILWRACAVSIHGVP